jgi:hypothetical protein
MQDDRNFDLVKAYNGNPLLKRANQQIEWTPELIQEYVKCSEDPIYFVETYMKIVSLDKGLVHFKLYDYQKQMLLNFKNERFNIITSARQSGKSTTTCGFILWYVLFQSEKTVALLANKGEVAREILGRIQLAYEHLPKWLQHGVLKWNEGSFELDNNSRVIASTTTKDAIRGYSISLLFVDEAAHIEKWDEFYTSVYPTISSGVDSKIILVSTPFGLNHFHKFWVGAKERKNQFKPLRVHWKDVPGRDEKWKKDTLDGMNGDLQKFAQEMECEFQGSSGTLIAGWKLKELIWKSPETASEGLHVYVSPRPNRIYMMVCDVSRGKGLDYSAFQLIDVTEMPYEQVAVYRDNYITPLDYAAIVHRVAIAYNNSAVLVEINDIGEQVSTSLHYDFNYDNVLFTENAGRSGKRITSGFGGKQIDKGIRTTKVVKNIGCSILKLLVEQNQLIINDFNTIEELSTFSKKKDSYEAEPGKHDDLVMGLVLFSWLSDQGYFKDYANIHTMQKLRDKTDEEIEQDLAQFLFVYDGRDEPDPNVRPYDGDNWMYYKQEKF